MADNFTITPGVGLTVGADEISTVYYQRIKLIYGADGVNSGDVADANPFPSKITDGTRIATVRDTGSNDSLNVAIVDASGNQITSFGGGTQYTEDAASAADPIGGALILRRRDSLSTETTTDGDNTAANCTGKGELYVKHVDAIAATQSGTWNVNNVSGTVSLPTGASTAANQSTIITSVQLLDDVVVTDNAGFTDGTTKLNMAGYIYDEVAGTALTENDAAAARINANRAVVGVIEDGATRTRYATVTASNALKVDGSAVTQPVSGTVTANAGSGTFTVSGTVTANAGTGTFTVADNQTITDNAGFTDGTSKLFVGGFIYDEVAGTALTENDAAAARINVNRAQIGIIEDGTTRGRYATVTASNAVKVDGSAVTQPISGTVAISGTPNVTTSVSANKQGSSTVAMSSTANAYMQGVTGYSACVTQITGTWTGTLIAEGSVDSGTTYVALPMVAQDTGVQVSSVTANGNYFIPIAGLTNVRIRCSIVGTGTANVALNEISGGGYANVSGVIQARTQDGSGNSITSRATGGSRPFDVAIVDGSGNQITSFGGGTQYTEDAAAAADPVGNMLILRRRDTPNASEVSNDGDNIAAIATNKGELRTRDGDAIIELQDINSYTSTVAACVVGDGNSHTFGIGAMGSDGTNARRLKTNTSGELVLAIPTSGGLSQFRNLDLGNTGQVVKASAGQVYSYYMSNKHATNWAYVKFYNKATAASSADTPVRTIAIPPASAANLAMDKGLEFTTGISVRATTGVADADTTSPATNDCIVNIDYK